MKRDLNKEKKVLAEIYANKANSIKYLPFFFRERKELRHFFNMFGGKTLVLPDTYEEFLEICLKSDCLLEDEKQKGIDKNIHDRTKDRILQSYINLFDSLQDVIINETKD